MDRFLAPHSPEAQAHSLVTESTVSWDMEHPSLNETLIAGCASYQALSRYLTGADLVFYPRTRRELENVLRRYSYDAIHNIIARARSSVAPGGYSRVCHIAECSLHNVLDSDNNVAVLLSLHSSAGAEHAVPDLSPPRQIKI
ncbi:hypothetical protein DFH94DRAFT_717140 [Russula ochroleuca]|uniref:Uncharacterized protein n=1 Tax=Russula ochroleuca TaxID=152965 RepID=A0A9P5TCF0_9AGAM|nr:hypothetical protein DFH94DRAFT_717140 [Russula ochroleuca]